MKARASPLWRACRSRSTGAATSASWGRAVATRLSGGERQRVSIARALANRPAVILGDEPTGDVDSKTGEQIMACIHDARKQSGATLVVVTHNPDVAKGADRTLHMKDG